MPKVREKSEVEDVVEVGIDVSGKEKEVMMLSKSKKRRCKKEVVAR